jgi:uncharacterized protein with PIN domain
MKCKNCGNELEFIPNYTHEDIETNLDRTDDVWVCVKCDALHWKEGEYNIFQKPVREQIFKYNALKSDYEVAVIKMKEKEYAEEI